MLEDSWNAVSIGRAGVWGHFSVHVCEAWLHRVWNVSCACLECACVAVLFHVRVLAMRFETRAERVFKRVSIMRLRACVRGVVATSLGRAAQMSRMRCLAVCVVSALRPCV